jgi:porphobilinogen deaminase
VEIKVIKTTGDQLQGTSLAAAGLPKGLFTKELEVALFQEEADIAVHSLKDLPTELPEGLGLGAVLPREDVRDVLICRASVTSSGPSDASLTRAISEIQFLPQDAIVGTSSTRRHAQLQELRPDLQIVPIRGNVPTRLRKVADPTGPHAIVLAYAGLRRLHFAVSADGTLEQDSASELEGHTVPAGLNAKILGLDTMLPCVGQGAIALEIRLNDERVRALCAQLNHLPSEQAVTAERSFLRAMGGGCQLAVAAHAELRNGAISLRAVSYLSSPPRRGEMTGPDAATVGAALARELGGAS